LGICVFIGGFYDDFCFPCLVLFQPQIWQQFGNTPKCKLFPNETQQHKSLKKTSGADQAHPRLAQKVKSLTFNIHTPPRVPLLQR
ncbi:MAG: hypothetical protein PHV28_13305, partial [Kiritimatiellae bacterium]|nr:hypothetical protein [Kiritimatiellia bacterium]